MTDLFDKNDSDEFTADLELKARPRLARDSDPETSHQGAARVEKKLGRLHHVFLAKLKGLVHGTANEIAQGDPSLRKRATELVRLGYIKVDAARTCGFTGSKATAYRLTEKGEKQFEL